MTDSQTVTPYNSQEAKKKQVADMFNNISGSYDFLNHFFSLGIDVLWRKKAVGMMAKDKPESILDVATGTADFALEARRAGAKEIIGVDISAGMLDRGREKVLKAGADQTITLTLGDSENLPFETNRFDAVMVSFGVRNFENLDAGLREMYRVLKPEGKLTVIEFSQPKKFPFKQLFWVYFRYLMPTVGKWISKDPRAYTYLPESVKKFPSGTAFTDRLLQCGFQSTEIYPLTGGIASIYRGKK